MANKIFYKNKIILDMSKYLDPRIRSLSDSSGVYSPENNKSYYLRVSGGVTRSIALPNYTSMSPEKDYVNRIKIYLRVEDSSTINLGTTQGFPTVPTLTDGYYILDYEYVALASTWTVDVKPLQ